jgi:hypothetical protein
MFFISRPDPNPDSKLMPEPDPNKNNLDPQHRDFVLWIRISHCESPMRDTVIGKKTEENN